MRAQQCLSWRTTRTRTPEHAREPLDTHVNPSTCTWAGPPTHISSGPRAGYQARVQVIRPTCGMSGPRAGHQANVRLQGPACVWAGRCAVTSTRALTAILPDGNYGTVVAGPSNWTRLLAAVTHSLRTSTHLAAEHPHPRSTTWINVHMTMPEPPHTRHNAGFTGTRQTQPPKKATVPHQKTEKSPYQQHAVSYNPPITPTLDT